MPERFTRVLRRESVGIRTIYLLNRILGGLAALVLFGLLVLTCIDVIGRYVFNAPLIGAYELTELGLAMIVFAGLPHVTQAKEHVTVDLIDMVTGRRASVILQYLIDAICGVILFVMAWVLWERAAMVASSGIHTPSLFIPMAPVAHFMSFAAAAAGAALVVRIVDKMLRGGEEPPAAGPEGPDGR